MDKLSQFTSTGMKIINHPEVIELIKLEGKASPVSLQVAPTSRCNLKCVFCSNVNRDKHEDLDFDELISIIYQLEYLGLKTVEWTGGGDPLMYKSIYDAIDFCHEVGLKQGLITNGLLLSEFSASRLDKLAWIRVSMNCLDYVDGITIPEISGTLGFSYVMNEKTTGLVMESLHCYVKKYEPEYVRIVPNCQATFAEQERNNEVLSATVENWRGPYFYQEKQFEAPKNCWWCYFKPFLLHDGYVYPCSSVVLNDLSERQFHNRYRWTLGDNLYRIYKEKMEPYPTSSCNKCVFKPQNDIIESILNPPIHEDFI